MSNPTTTTIREQYGQTARRGLSSQDAGVSTVAEAFGYSADELAAIPAEANMGLSCGNPTAIANLREGETVLDLGSGGGLDVFLAAQKVGPTGQAIGVDMTPDMIDLARRNAQQGPDGKPYPNVAFRLGEIEAMPVADASVDVVISNCVINLAQDKSAVFREMSRVLKPGGRVAVSDIALKQPLPQEMADNIAAWVGCIAGAIEIQTYEEGLREAGFEHVVVVETGADLNAYANVEGQSACCSSEPQPATSQAAEGCCSSSTTSDDGNASGSGSGCCTPVQATVGEEDGEAEASCCTPSPQPLHQDLADLIKKYDINAYAGSVKVFAVKP